MEQPRDVDLLIHAAAILPMTSPGAVLWNASVAINQDRILEVGPTNDLSERYRSAKVLALSHHLVMPGLINTHTHLFGTFCRGIVNDLSFTAWVQKKFYLTSRGLNKDNYYLATLMACLDMVKSGTTTFLDCGTSQGLEESAVRGVTETGLRAVLARTMADIDDELGEFLKRPETVTEKNIEETTAFIETWDRSADGRVRTWACPIQVTSVTDRLFVEAMELAEKYDVGVATHSNVDREDIANHAKYFQTRPIERFHKLGILNRRFLATHMGWLSDLEVELMRESKASAIHCPSASMKLAYGALSHGKFPELLDKGVTVGLGTDGPAASSYYDMFREIYLAATGHKEARMNPVLVSPYEAIELATHGSAKAILMEGEIGSLEAGKKADLVALDMLRPEWIPWHEDNILNNLVYSATGASVSDVFIDGRHVVAEGRMLTIDEDAILREVQAAAHPFVVLSHEWDRLHAARTTTTSG